MAASYSRLPVSQLGSYFECLVMIKPYACSMKKVQLFDCAYFLTVATTHCLV